MARLGRGVLALAVLLAAASCSREVEAPPDDAARTPTAEELQQAPIYVDIGVQGRFGLGRSWSLHVEWDGRAALFLGTSLDLLEGPSERFLDLGREGIERIRQSLIRERFFELEPTFGRPVDDGSLQWIDVRLGSSSHRVEILYAHREEIRTGRNEALGTLDGLDRAWRVFDAITEPIEGGWGAAYTPAYLRLLEERNR